MIQFSKETEDALKKRGKVFRSLPVSDWHQIIAFEKIVRNYMKMKNLLNEQDKNMQDEKEEKK